jgi:two-component system, LytTR family, response regulator
MRCIVIDDDDIQRNILSGYINKIDGLELAGSFENPAKALEFIQGDSVELIVLDVEMPMMSGLELLDSLSKKPQVILATSYEKYAVSAFNFDVTDYLVKPVEFPRFFKAINKAMERKKLGKASGSADYDLFVKDGSDLIKINTADIMFVNALSDYVKIITPKKEYAVLYTMKNLFTKLPTDKFMRVHRSYIVRLDAIEKISEHIIEIGKHLIPVSKSYRDELYFKINLLK